MDINKSDRLLCAPGENQKKNIILSFDMHGVLQDRTVVSVTAELAHKYGLTSKEKIKLHYSLFREIPAEFEEFLTDTKVQDKKEELEKELKESSIGKNLISYFELSDIQFPITPQEHIQNAFEFIGIKENNLGTKIFENYKRSIALNQEFLDVIKAMRKEGYVVGITTDRLRLAYEVAYERYIKEYFDPIIISSHETGILKSQDSTNFEQFKKKAICYLGTLVTLPTFIHVDDSEKNNANARKAGFETISYEWKDSNKTGVFIPDIAHVMGRLYTRFKINF